MTTDPNVTVLAQIKEIAVARALAVILFWGKTTKSEGKPYIFHLETVASTLPLEDQAAGWLHDVLEDTKVTMTMLVEAGIRTQTMEVVAIVSRLDPMRESYEEFITRIIDSGNLSAIRVKIADVSHNLRPSCPPDLAKRYLKALPLLQAALMALTKGGGYGV